MGHRQQPILARRNKNKIGFLCPMGDTFYTHVYSIQATALTTTQCFLPLYPLSPLLPPRPPPLFYSSPGGF